MVKRNEMLVRVRDPKGQVHEVTRRNATDLVQHRGWKWDRVEDDTIQAQEAALAQSPRNRRERSEKMDAVRKLAAETKTLPEDDDVVEDAPATGKKAKGRPKKAAAVPAPVHNFDDDDDEDVKPFDAAASEFDDELDELEREEAARGNG